MKLIKYKIDLNLKSKNLSRYQLCQIIGYPESSFNQMVRGERPFAQSVIEKILPILEVTREEFESWILADKYSKEIIELAIKYKKEHKKKNKQLILTIKIDEILKSKNMSRTGLSKEINYSQSGLNRMITGQIPMSESVRKRVAMALEITEEEILSWAVAGKYSLKTLELIMLKLL